MSKEYIHTFAGNPLDRADIRARDERWLRRALDDPQTRFVAFDNLEPVAIEESAPRLLRLGKDQFAPAGSGDSPPVFLGLEDGTPLFAVDVTNREIAADGAAPVKPRQFAMLAPDGDSAIMGQAKALIDWHRRHGFCSVCGAESEPVEGGRMRRCADDDCGAMHFPRTDPVVIMLITDGPRCLLGRSRRFPDGFYSALAGFVEPGESIEEAVRRETLEEAGIRIGAVHYHSSQPWPFYSSLMIGCTGEALSRDIVLLDDELTDARWFTQAEIEAALGGSGAGGINIPPPIAIAHHLIKGWLQK